MSDIFQTIKNLAVSYLRRPRVQISVLLSTIITIIVIRYFLYNRLPQGIQKRVLSSPSSPMQRITAVEEVKTNVVKEVGSASSKSNAEATSLNSNNINENSAEENNDDVKVESRSEEKPEDEESPNTQQQKRVRSRSSVSPELLLLQDEQQTKLGQESNHLFGIISENNNSNNAATATDTIPFVTDESTTDTEVHKKDDDSIGVIIQKNSGNDIDETPASKSKQSQPQLISPPASPLLKAVLQRTNSSLSPRSRRPLALDGDNNNASSSPSPSVVLRTLNPRSSSEEVVDPLNATYPSPKQIPSLLSSIDDDVPDFAKTISQRDMKKLVSGTHLVGSSHAKEKSWLKRSGSQVMMTVAVRKEWEDSLIREFSQDRVLSRSASSSEISSMNNVSNQVSAHASPERRPEERNV